MNQDDKNFLTMAAGELHNVLHCRPAVMTFAMMMETRLLVVDRGVAQAAANNAPMPDGPDMWRQYPWGNCSVSRAIEQAGGKHRSAKRALDNSTLNLLLPLTDVANYAMLACDVALNGDLSKGDIRG